MRMDFFTQAKLHVLDTPIDVAKETLAFVLKQAHQAIDERGVFTIVLAGGSTPVLMYSLLAKCNEEWDKWRFFIGDERCLPQDDPERNSVVICQAFAGKVLTPENTFFIPAEIGAEEAAHAYGALILSYLPFDMVLLGMGEDGHTASIFPGIEQMHKDVYVSYNSPKPPPTRITMSKETLSNTSTVLFMITGANKNAPLQNIKNGELLPVTQVKGKDTIIMFDQDAVSQLDI